MMKRLAALLLALMMVLSLAACGKGDPAGTMGSENDAETEPDMATYEYEGLLLDIPNGYTDMVEISITRDNAYDDTSATRAAYIAGALEGQYDIVDTGVMNGVSYVMFKNENESNACIRVYYVSGGYIWDVFAKIEDFDNFGEDGYEALTGGTIAEE